MAETLHTALHPQPAGPYLIGYLVLLVVVGLYTIALVAGLRPLRARAAQRHLKLAAFLWRGTDPAVTTLVLSSAARVLDGVTAPGSSSRPEPTPSIALTAALARADGRPRPNGPFGRDLRPCDLGSDSANMKQLVTSTGGSTRHP